MHLSSPVLRRILTTALTGALFTFAVWLGLQFVARPEGMSVLWPANGLLMAALLLSARPQRYLNRTVALLVLIVANRLGGNSGTLSVMFALVNVGEASLAAFIVSRACPERLDLGSLRQVVTVFVACASSALVSAFVGTAGLVAFASAPFGTGWLTWWVADTTGLVLVASIALAIRGKHPRARQPMPAWRILEMVAVFAAAAATVVFTFPLYHAVAGLHMRPYMAMLVILWAALRLDHRFLCVLVGGTAVVATGSAVHGGGPFATIAMDQKWEIVATQLYIVALTVVAFVPASIMRERDRTQEELQDRERQARELFEGIGDYALLLDFTNRPSPKVLDANESACAQHGYTLDEFRGMPLTALDEHVPDDDRRKMLEPLLRGETLQFEVEHVRKDGTLFPVEVKARLVASPPGTVWVLATERDITDRKLAERTIMELNASLEGRVIERTEQLQLAIRELESFAYSISHDLRAPLRAIDGFSYILQHDYGPAMPPPAMELCDHLCRNARRMGSLIDGLLAFSRLGRTDMDSSDLDMAALAQAAYDDLTDAVERESVTFTLGDLPQVRGDAVLVRQVWENLLANALKFTGTRQDRRIEVGGRVDGAECVYTVRDNGVGFDMAYADKLFGVFHRLHGATEFEGTGVGLAIVHRIVTRHGGRIWAEGEPGVGATLSFALPVHGLPTQDARRTAPPAARL